MMTTKKFIDIINKEEAALLDKFNMQRKMFAKKHNKFVAVSLLLALMFLLIAVGSIVLSCLTKLQLTGLILCGLDIVTAIYCMGHIKKKIEHFMIEFDTICNAQKETFAKIQDELYRQYDRLVAFEIFYSSAIYRTEIVEPLLKRGMSEFDIGQIIVEIRDTSKSFEEFQSKIQQLYINYNLKENN